MKITSSKIDDIKKARDEYEADYEKRHAQFEEEHENYRKAHRDVMDPVKKYIETVIQHPLLDFTVDVQSAMWGRKGLSVRIGCNQNRLHDENSALSWDYKVELDENGIPQAETGSWSGLSAVTPEQMASLEASVGALKELNSMNWAKLLDKTLPRWDDYHTVSDYRGNRPNFEQQLREAEFEEYIGSDVALQGSMLENFGFRAGGRGKVWYLIFGETPKQYKVACFMDYSWEQWKNRKDEGDNSWEGFVDREKRYAQRIRKDTLLSALDYPFVEHEE